MKTSKSEIISRQNKIINYLRKNNCIKITELADMFGVSDTTIRRDIHLLANYGEAIRCKNNICMLDIKRSHPRFDDEKGASACTEEKDKIAQYAATLLEDGDTVFFNSSSTALRVIPYIKNKAVTIITNNGRSLFTDRDSSTELVLIGGEVIGNTKMGNSKMYTTGTLAVEAIEKISATKCILGVSGISAKGGLTSMAVQDPAVNQAMIRHCSGPVIVVADHRKVGIQHSFFFGNLSDVSCLITDAECDPCELEKIRQTGVEVIIADTQPALPEI
ncbi:MULTISPECIES: DeoR/GlpR family DNA-binding transcription regulator [Lachnospiraceae]|jgi:DeoR family fructose operon transcriptional repressor|uniref:DeoR/GlpR family DNA-binding transcription regulator n=1 Tax=Faecalicatena acetigenes TaxID=2981790 RepID=A0ABT2TA79_9FIRM|nr:MULTISPECIES: DeoR/GlpR family DNA-binding transcription regulator [Lachnospiraceae]MCU6746886.1 DeoR/GlpR family DNA-binding transcription regulator [Faecalicatena acetigenes]SCH49373.1 HTH-type transcriptional repressor glcR [uncultured Clostridium sp.]